jgi:hypothetical protein
MTDLQLLIVVVLIFGTSMTYWAWSISDTLMDIKRILLELRTLQEHAVVKAREADKELRYFGEVPL